jgi:peroxiredoxin
MKSHVSRASGHGAALAKDVRRVAMGALAVFAMLFVSASFAAAAPVVGKQAPAFTAIDSEGRSHSLADYRGRVVVLEWTNHECPYTVKHYDAGAMQALQKEAREDGVVWLSVVSSAPGEQGHVTADEANALTASRGAAPTAVLLDPEGEVGRAYDARTTPHMYIVDADGTLRYMGAIDDNPSARSDPAEAHNYVRAGLREVLSGRQVTAAATPPYGCTVKYGG